MLGGTPQASFLTLPHPQYKGRLLPSRSGAEQSGRGPARQLAVRPLDTPSPVPVPSLLSPLSCAEQSDSTLTVSLQQPLSSLLS